MPHPDKHILQFISEDRQCQLCITPVEVPGGSGYQDNDAYLLVDVRSRGFAGSCTVWVSQSVLEDFKRDLASLEKTLRGKARLGSISPDELEIEIASISSKGNIAVQGKAGSLIQGKNGSFRHSISFGFEFEAQQLSTALRQAWLMN